YFSENISYPPFQFGETLTDNLANYNAASIYADEPKGEYRGQTTPVGLFPPNAFGLYDMHGNVYEWCKDYYHQNYENAPMDGSAWLSSNINTTKILRGGSWDDYPNYCRCAYRVYLDIGSKNYRIGLRVVRVPQPNLMD
ncbi:MAG: formylglycine-generating enzyme family protein, partial [Coleofasciculus sp. C2-GNP5-27]